MPKIGHHQNSVQLLPSFQGGFPIWVPVEASLSFLRTAHPQSWKAGGSLSLHNEQSLGCHKPWKSAKMPADHPVMWVIARAQPM